MKQQDYIYLEDKFGAHNYEPLDVVITKGDGVWVYDLDGNRYLDCLSSYSALNQGHVHPKILESLVTQAAKLTLTSRAFRNDQLPLFYKELCELTGYEMAITMNSGAEAVETALKIARKWAYQIKGVEKEYISILGIFAAIVLAFVGGITFSTSVLQNISAVSAFRLLLVVDFLAFVLINVIYILVKFIFTINEKDAKLFNIKALNISCLVIALIVIISWLFNANQIPDYISGFLPWSK